METLQNNKRKKQKKPILNNEDFYYDISEDDGAGYDGFLRIISVYDGSCVKIEIGKLLDEIERQKLTQM